MVRVWSDRPTTASGKASMSSVMAPRRTFSGGVGYMLVVCMSPKGTLRARRIATLLRMLSMLFMPVDRITGCRRRRCGPPAGSCCTRRCRSCSRARPCAPAVGRGAGEGRGEVDHAQRLHQGHEPALLVLGELAALHDFVDGLPGVAGDDLPGLLAHLVLDHVALELDAFAAHAVRVAHHALGLGVVALVIDADFGDDERGVVRSDFASGQGDLGHGSAPWFRLAER